MPWIIAGGALLGSALAGSSAERAARTTAASNEKATQLAAEEQRFRPVGITSRFGSSQFQFGPEGRLTGAGYQASPEIQALQDRLSVLYGDSLGLAEMAPSTARGIFNLGTGYLSESPEAARQRIYDKLQEARLPSQMREEERLAASVFGRGNIGLNISGRGQPGLFALAQAREEQRMQDLLAAEQQAQQQVGFGTSLLGTAYQLPVQALSPFQAQFGTQQLLEESARAPLDIGAQLGGRTAQAGANVGNTLLSGSQNAANLRLQGSMVTPTLMASNISNISGQLMQGYQQQQLMNQLMNQRTASIYGTSPMSQQTQMLSNQWNPNW
jgi:hypothetical protein